jgi:YVTN family beta-propeller protein
MNTRLLSSKLAAFILLTTVATMTNAAETFLLIATIPLPNVKGRIDHLSADIAGRKLYVAALGNNTVEIVDTASHKHEKSVPGFGEPQGLVYVPGGKRLFVGNGSAGRVDIVDTRSLTTTRQIGKLDDADNVRYDAAGGKIIVGYGKGALRTLDAETGESAGDVSLEGHPESFQLEQSGTRVFVNVPSAGHVAVVDRSKRQVAAVWKVSARANFPMALDEKGRRLFVGARTPAVVLVHDIDSGKEVAKLKIGEDTDDLFFDRDRRRLYVICGAGQVDVFRQEAADRYVQEDVVKTAPRARTGLFVSEEKRLYVAAPAVGGEPARILVYEVKEPAK